MQQERKHRPVDYERAIEAQDREEARVLEAQIQRFTSRLRVKLYHNLERLRGRHQGRSHEPEIPMLKKLADLLRRLADALDPPQTKGGGSRPEE